MTEKLLIWINLYKIIYTNFIFYILYIFYFLIFIKIIDKSYDTKILDFKSILEKNSAGAYG